jgi:hypothetical protein
MDMLVSYIVNHIPLQPNCVYLLNRYDYQKSTPIPNIFTSIEKVSEYLVKFVKSRKAEEQKVSRAGFCQSLSYFTISLQPLNPDTFQTNIVTLFKIGHINNGELVIRLEEDDKWYPIMKKLNGIYHLKL